MKSSFLIVLSLLCFVQCGLCFSSTSWDFMLYVTQWPGSVDQSTVPAGVDSFTLHGLWPTNNDTTYPADCPGPSFSLSAIQNLVPQMEVDWPSLEGSGGNEAFWSHEWEKHGTCATNGEDPNLYNEASYFAFALALHSQFNTLNVLEQAGIKPSSSQSYSISQFVTALKNAFGVDPILTCQESDSRVLLETIEFCVSSGGKLFECNSEFFDKSKSSSGCGDSSIYYPPIKTNSSDYFF
eukprot:TRINITY_DN16314_c0_g1_i1.p1 TRINITY_DN16314_c0_g1~~TRINITY_DN16314_c0_g1_i1.p1  ORF type:complete len:238 (-),score=42.87 TRINITY_DN16314_c0_g1_i1:181-894(-)